MKIIKENEANISFEYQDFPMEGTKTAKIEEFENGEGFDVWLGNTHIELSNQEITVLELLFAQARLIK
jgi:hypothetical protein